MEKITDWSSLWRELVEVKSRSRKRDMSAEPMTDVWRARAREFDEGVKRRWAKPDSSRAFILSQLDADSTVLDIGAGTGAWSALLARRAKHVTAVEPSSAMAEVMRENLTADGITNVVESSMPKHIAILTGPFGSGKTTACRQLADLARRRGLDCAGIVCPARFDGAHKVGIDLVNLRTGESRPLAEADDQPSELRTTHYRFDVDGMAWGAAILDAACPCDVLIVDEIGPIELERGQGWVNALKILREGQCDLAVVVVRPGLVDAFRAAVGDVPSSLFTLPFSQSDNYHLDDIMALKPARGHQHSRGTLSTILSSTKPDSIR